MKLDYRNIGVIKNTEPEGIVQAYLTQWGSVDSYNSTFKRGAFSESFQKRPPNKIRVLWNHYDLAGKTIDAREDDYGPLVKVQFNLKTDAGKTAFNHIEAGDIDAFSFGFRRNAEEVAESGVRLITQIEVVEVSPVVFEANDKAKIIDFRSESRPDIIEELAERLLSLNLTEDEKRDIGVSMGILLSEKEVSEINDFRNMLQQFQNKRSSK